MARRRRTHRYEDGVDISPVQEEPAPQGPRRWPKMLGIGFVAGLLAATISWFIYSSQKPRTLRVHVYTDFAYRQKHSNWEQVIRDRVAGLNAIYEHGAGLRWELQSTGQADPTAFMHDLDFRRRRLAEQPGQPADLLLGFAGQAGGPVTVSVVPFSHAAMVLDTSGEADTPALAHQLAQLFGALPVSPQAVNGPLSETERNLIRRLRDYDFEHGTQELASARGDRVIDALAEAYRNLGANPAARAHEVAARSLIAEHRLQPAVSHLREALKLDPKNASARLTLAATLIEDGDFKGAADAIHAGIAADPGNTRLSVASAAVDAKAAHTPEAILGSTELVAHYPRDAELNALLGWLFLPEAGLIGQSSTAFANARNADPTTPSALRGMERAAAAKRQAMVEVERRREAVRQHVDRPDAYFNLGVALLIAAEFDQAQEAFQRAVALNPNFGKAHVDLALIHWLKHDYPAADREAAAARKSGEEPSAELMRVIRNGMGR